VRGRRPRSFGCLDVRRTRRSRAGRGRRPRLQETGARKSAPITRRLPRPPDCFAPLAMTSAALTPASSASPRCAASRPLPRRSA
jgi:hypothetical protein